MNIDLICKQMNRMFTVVIAKMKEDQSRGHFELFGWLSLDIKKSRYMPGSPDNPSVCNF